MIKLPLYIIHIYTRFYIFQVEDKEGAKGSLISDIPDVSQYRVISEDINLDILPLEQDISNSGPTDGTFIQVRFAVEMFYLLDIPAE